MRYWLWMIVAANALIPMMAFMVWSESLPWSRFWDFLISPIHATHAAITNGIVVALVIIQYLWPRVGPFLSRTYRSVRGGPSVR